jgi:redox-sensitive bicupin YhaK (pirin superfamily)
MIKKIFKANEVKEGAGVIVNRVFGHNETTDFDPFLMLDYFETDHNIKSPGFPWHPHKGLETISYFLRGSGRHEDSLGNEGTIAVGELQWMSAGRGILHQEMPGSSSDGIQGFQFWVNMPRKDKLNAPSYQFIKKGKMKSIKTEGKIIRVIAGHYKDVLGPIDKSNLGITMLHVTLEEGIEIDLKRTKDKQGFVFVFEGNETLDSDEIEAVTAYTLEEGPFIIKADKQLSFIYAEGTPLKEPIVWQGPIVMNTRDEIIETYRDLEKGTFIK